MRIIIDNNVYVKIKTLRFDPQADLAGSSVVVNRFNADIYTEDEISVGVNAYLKDDLGKLWAKYWITRAERIDKTTMRIEAQSIILLLDRFDMPAKMYENESITEAITEVFSLIQAIYPTTNLFTIDNALSGVTYSGYAPEQSARDRLLWLVFVAGAYVKTYFTETVDIKVVDDTLDVIPINKTFWKPSISYGDWVTAIKAKAYIYTEGEPQTTDEWVEVDGTYYIQEERELILVNPDAPVTAADNEIVFDNITLINVDNVDEILTRLSTYYFERIEVDADIINNGEYIVGERYSLNTDENNLVAGYITSATFTFGLQAKSKIKLVQTETINGSKLTIEYWWDDTKIGEHSYYFPVGYVYSVENPFIDKSLDDHRYIFYPLDDSATGTVGSEPTVDEEEYSVAIDLCEQIAFIYNVDELEMRDEVLDIE